MNDEKEAGYNLIFSGSESNTFAGVAKIGHGKFKSRYGGKKDRAYKVWEGMITRCYVKSSKSYDRYGARGVTVCDEWFNYQLFAEWYTAQKHCKDSLFELDKDLTKVGNKVYCPEFCDLIPRRVNSLLISTNLKRGDLPVGVHRLKDKFKSSCRDGLGNKVHLGTFSTKDEAFNAYRSFKKGVIYRVATSEFKKGNISEIIYNNLINLDVVEFPE